MTPRLMGRRSSWARRNAPMSSWIFPGVTPGTNVILYSDAPPRTRLSAALRLLHGQSGCDLDRRRAPDPGRLGPNTRTIMQFRVQGTLQPAAFNLAALQTAWPATYVAFQPPPIVPQTVYPLDPGRPVNTTHSLPDQCPKFDLHPRRFRHHRQQDFQTEGHRRNL